MTQEEFVRTLKHTFLGIAYECLVSRWRGAVLSVQMEAYQKQIEEELRKAWDKAREDFPLSLKNGQLPLRKDKP